MVFLCVLYTIHLGKSNSKKVATALGVSLSFVVLVLLAVGIVIWRKTKKKKQSILNINGEDYLVFFIICDCLCPNLLSGRIELQICKKRI